MILSSLMRPSHSRIPFVTRSVTYFSPGKSLWQLFLEQFDDLLVKILLAAAVISFVSVPFNESLQNV